jgi:LPS export ABC transporter protein LptC
LLIAKCKKADSTVGRWLPAASYLLFLVSCGKSPDLPGAKGADLPNAELTDLELRSSDLGKVQWVFRAKTASLFQDRREVEAKTVYIEFYKEKKKVAKLTAEEATVDTESHDTLSRGHVVLTSLSTGEILESETLEWKASRERILTQSPVTVTRGKNVIRAQGLEADPELGEITFVKGVRMDIQQAPQPKAKP